MKLQFRREGTTLAPATQDALDWLTKLKADSTVVADFTAPRNYKFHKKFFALMNCGFEFFTETAPPVEYRGQRILPEFERFRKDITILAGYGHPVINVKLEVRYEAESIAFGNMSEERFEKLYAAVQQVLIERVFKNSPTWSRERIDAVVEELASFH